jgi:hypothetical protein
VGDSAGDTRGAPAGPARMTRGLSAGAALAALLIAPTAPAQTLRTLSSSRQLHGESALAVDVTYVAGRFRLYPAPPGALYQMEMRYDEDKFTPVRDYDAGAGVLRLGLKARGHVTLPRHGDEDNLPTLDLALAPDVPVSLSVALGAAEADAEFGGLALRSLHYETGASKSELRFSRPNPLDCDSLTLEAGAAQFTATGLANANCRRMKIEGGVGAITLDFTGTWRGPVDAEVHLALGTLRLQLPRNLGVTISLDRFLASFDQSGFTRRGDVYYSDNYASARYHLNLQVESAFGGIQVDWVNAAR